MKCRALLLVVVALAARQCEAGFLKDIGKGTENIGSAINKGAIKVEDSLTSLFHGKKEEAKPAAPLEKPAVPELAKKDSSSPDQALGQGSAEKRPDLASAPQIEIVYGQAAATQKPNRLASAVITDDDAGVDTAGPQKICTAEEIKQMKPDCPREIIMGAPRCGDKEIFVNGACRPRE